MQPLYFTLRAGLAGGGLQDLGTDNNPVQAPTRRQPATSGETEGGMGGGNLPQLLLNTDFCERDELAQKRGEEGAKEINENWKSALGKGRGKAREKWAPTAWCHGGHPRASPPLRLKEPGRSQPTAEGLEETMIKAENYQPWETDKYFKEERESCVFLMQVNSIKGGETELAVGVWSVILGFSLKRFRKIWELQSRWINGERCHLVGKTGD